jgi:hypothetical protein
MTVNLEFSALNNTHHQVGKKKRTKLNPDLLKFISTPYL